jgi:hypothetical protein
VGFDATKVGVNQHIRRLNRSLIRHAHFSEYVFNSGTHVVRRNSNGILICVVKSFQHCLTP